MLSKNSHLFVSREPIAVFPRLTKATISSRLERVIGHIGTETRPKLLREAAVGNLSLIHI